MALYFTVRALDEERPRGSSPRAPPPAGRSSGSTRRAAPAADPARAPARPARPAPARDAVAVGGRGARARRLLPGHRLERRPRLGELRVPDGARRPRLASGPMLVGRFVGLQAAARHAAPLAARARRRRAALRRRAEPSWRVCAIFSAPLLLLASCVSPFHWVKGNWLAPAYPTALARAAPPSRSSAGTRCAGGPGPPACSPASRRSTCSSSRSSRRSRSPPATRRTSGWRQLAARVEAERRAIGGDPLVVGCTYKPAAELEFNLPGRPATQSGGIFGANGLQYDVWLDPAAVRGRELLLVVDGREADACTAREALCRPLARAARPRRSSAGGSARYDLQAASACAAAGRRREARRRAWRGGTPPTRPQSAQRRSAAGRAGTRRSSRGGTARSRSGPDRPGRRAAAPRSSPRRCASSRRAGR